MQLIQRIVFVFPIAATTIFAAPPVLAESRVAAPSASTAIASGPPVEKQAVPAPAPAASGVVYPRAIDPKYARAGEGKARMRTCIDQYSANRANGGNGGLKWAEKGGGGYYPECNKRLRGAT
jgi:hypothetical protein